MSSIRLIGFANLMVKLNIKVVLTPFKVAYMFNVKDSIRKSLKSFVAYKFICPGCSACDIRETTRHVSTRSKEKGMKSHKFLDILLIMKLARRLVLKIILK